MSSFSTDAECDCSSFGDLDESEQIEYERLVETNRPGFLVDLITDRIRARLLLKWRYWRLWTSICGELSTIYVLSGRRHQKTKKKNMCDDGDKSTTSSQRKRWFLFSFLQFDESLTWLLPGWVIALGVNEGGERVISLYWLLERIDEKKKWPTLHLFCFSMLRRYHFRRLAYADCHWSAVFLWRKNSVDSHLLRDSGPGRVLKRKRKRESESEIWVSLLYTREEITKQRHDIDSYFVLLVSRRSMKNRKWILFICICLLLDLFTCLKLT